ncbi:DNA polymerase/3'-5' exonuclease PolX [Natroniella sulfidigena]|uniref:DNA polymerase/3'-5' exonuclease PolX n=1 Tax=Natroniella sulfidigena TaxID=723921 RepID=UPI00200A6392|nr:DNA polymerase/3'-5' exonuclease PolX [Natroniella sulfidigena]MCK8818104.1 DNA polymerase/3'-5' exonuclease PolX [Natroniella sulfidigena]
MNNLNVSLMLSNIAKLLKIKGENNYKVAAYEKASKIIKELKIDIKSLVEQEKLDSLPGIGESLAEKINEIVLTGNCRYYQELTDEYPVGLISLLEVSGLGSSKVRKIYNQLEIDNLADLKSKAESGQLSQISGIGAKTEDKILEGANRLLDNKGKVDLGLATELASGVMDYLSQLKSVSKVKIAGEIRRNLEVVTEVLLVVESDDFSEAFVAIKELTFYELQLQEDEEAVLMTEFGIAIRIVLASKEQFYFKLFELTGTEEYNERLKELIDFSAVKKEVVQIQSEAELFKLGGFPYIIPELRDDLASLEQAEQNQLPESIEVADIKGDLHMHSQWSDGSHTIEEMARACQQRGCQYLAICDHSKSLQVANGLSVEQLKRQAEEIDKLNQRLEITILKGIEVDILEDGLDYSNQVLEELDLVVASIHRRFNNSPTQIMERIFRALENPYVDILGHPTGRLVLKRPPYGVEMERVIKKAVETNTILEINSSPKRLDLNAEDVKLAKRLGAKVVINTDAHQIRQLDNLDYGVGVARKGWLESEDVVNTFNLQELQKILKRK